MKAPRRYRPLFSIGGVDAEAEMDREIESHIAMRTADLVRSGMDPETARAEAERRFGDLASARVRLHLAARQRKAAMRQRDVIGSVIADLRYAGRQVRRAPGFSLLAVATLALGIGATTTMFTLVDRVLLRPLPFRQPERLVALYGMDSVHNQIQTVSSDDWRDWQRAQSIQTAIYSFSYRQPVLTNDSALRVTAVSVSGNYFPVLGARFAVGRSFNEDEARQGGRVVVVSERIWRTLGGADPQLKTPIRTIAGSFPIVGVVAAGQEFPAGIDIWFPTEPVPGQPRVNINWFAMGRLRDGATAERAHAELGAIARGIHATDHTALYDYDVLVPSLASTLVGPVSSYLEMLMGVVVLVLIIVCANVAASALARGSARSREMAVRTSLGAVRGRLIQQLLVEHICLGLIAGALGLFVAWAATRGIVALWGDSIPRASEIAIDARVFFFALGVSLFAGVTAGILPALRTTRVSLSAMMASGGRNSSRGGRNLAGSSLVSLEIALALLLLTGAGLLIRSFQSVMGRDVGFDTNVATAEVALSGPTYRTDVGRRLTYWKALIDSYEKIPGVEGAAVSNWIPLGMTGQGFIDVEGANAGGDGAAYRTVSDDYFKTLRMPVLLGRGFDKTDGPTSPRVVIINRAFANRYWPGTSPIGRRIRAKSMEADGQKAAAWLTIVGVVGDSRGFGLEQDERAEMYVYFEQAPNWFSRGMTALVRGSMPATQLFGEMRRRAHEVDPQIAIDVGTLSERLRGILSTRVVTMSVLAGFAGIAMLLAALGIYGVLSYAVAQRTRELAVRAALGAGQRQLLGLVFREGLRVVVIGMVFGVAGAFWLTRALDSMLVGVGAIDPVSYLAAIAVLFVASMAAIVLPAHRATKMDPMIALQAE